MLVVKVELHSGITGEVSEIAKMYIINDGRGNQSIGNYDIYMMPDGEMDGSLLDGDHSKIKGWPRKNHVWELVKKAVEAFSE